MHVGIANPRWWWWAGGGTFPAFPAHARPSILRILQEAQWNERILTWNSPHAGESAISSDASAQSSIWLHTRTSLTVLPSLQRNSPTRKYITSIEICTRTFCVCLCSLYYQLFVESPDLFAHIFSRVDVINWSPALAPGADRQSYDVMPWKRISREGNPPVTLTKDQWCATLMLTLISVWTNFWTNNRELNWDVVRLIYRQRNKSIIHWHWAIW